MDAVRRSPRIFSALPICMLFFAAGGLQAMAGDGVKARNVSAISAPAQAAETPGPELALRAYLEAVRSRDADRAFALSSTRVRQEASKPEHLMKILRYDRYPLYGHESYRLLQQNRISETALVQKIEVVSETGKAMTILCRIVRGEGGNWAVDSTILLDGGKGRGA